MLDWRCYFCILCIVAVFATPSSIQDGAGGIARPIAGQPFSLQLTGAGLTLADRMRVVASSVSCGRSGAASGPGNTVTSLSRRGVVGTSGALSTSQRWYNLVVPSVGDFRVCWCGPPSCRTDFDFNVDVGTFTIRGPLVRPADCTATVSCTIQLTGTAFTATGGLILLKSGTCGSSSAVPSSWSGFTNPKPANIRQGNGSIFQMTSFMSSYDLEPLAGHRMCWGWAPTRVQDYSVDVGNFRMLPGASMVHSRCSLGHECTIRLPGTGFAASNQILISTASACGRQGRASFHGFTNPQQVSAVSPHETYVFGTSLTATVGQYILCWAHAPSMVVDWFFLLKVGSLLMCGPSSVHVKRMTNGTIVGATLAPIPLELFVIEIRGVGLNAANRLRVIALSDSCGSEAAVNHTGSLSGPLLDTPNMAGMAGSTGSGSTSRAWPELLASMPVDLRVCWCSSHCYLGSDFRVQAGQFGVRGPSAMHTTSLAGASDALVAGVEFELQLSGLGLMQTDRIRIVEASTMCGSDNALLNAFEVSGPSRSLLSGPGSAGSSGSAATSAKWGRLRLDGASLFRACWCGLQCDEGSGFAVELGSLTILGPRIPQHFVCFAAANCSIDLVGLGFSKSSAVLLVPQGSCGQSNAEVLAWGGLVNPSFSPKTSKGEDAAAYFLGSAMAGPLGRVASVCWANAPSSLVSALDYIVDVGNFVMHGPEQVSVECELGIACRFDVNFTEVAYESVYEGSSESSSARVVAHGECESLASAALVGFVNPAFVERSLDMTAHGKFELGVATHGVGTYELCWRHGSSSGPGYAFGSLSVHGPSGITDGSHSSLRPLVHAPFNLEVFGQSLDTHSRVRIVESSVLCGSNISAQNTRHLKGSLLEGPGMLTTAVRDGYRSASLTWRSLSLTSAGHYRVCWCARGACALDDEFNVDVGSIIVPNARVNVDSRVIAGDAFCLTLVGDHLRATDHLRLMDSRNHCGSQSAAGIGMSAVTPSHVVNSTNGVVTSLRWCSLQVDHRASLRACWCGDMCASAADFVADAGVFAIHGPHPAGVVTCVATTRCSISLTGSGLLARSGILLVDSSDCGNASATLANWHGLNNPQVCTENLVEVATFDLGIAVAMPMAPATLCWASEPGGSAAPSDYRVFVGTVVMHGPENTSMDCYPSGDCGLQLHGTSLGFTSKVSLAEVNEGCSVNNTMWFSNLTGLEAVTTTTTTLTTTSTSTSTSSTTTTTTPLTTTKLILSSTAVNTTIAIMKAAATNSTIAAMPTSTSVELTTTTATTATTTLIATETTTTRATTMMTSTATPKNATGSQTTTTSTGFLAHQHVLGTYASGVYVRGRSQVFLLCWRHRSITGPSMAVGLVRMLGPLTVTDGAGAVPQAYPFSALTLDIVGSGLSGSNRIRIVSATRLCGSRGTAADSDIFDAQSLSTVGKAGIVGSTGRLSTSIMWTGVSFQKAGVFEICWCRNGACNRDHDFDVVAGQVTILGPSQVVALSHDEAALSAATVGVSFILELRGTGLAKDDQVLLVDRGSGCGRERTLQSALTNPQLNYSNTTLRWPLTVLRRVSTYNVCWCHAPTCQSSNRWLLVGSLVVLGPSLIHAVCVATLPCIIHLIGTGLSSADEMSILRSGSCGSNASNAKLSDWVGLKNPARVRNQTERSSEYALGIARAGPTNIDFKLCWRSVAGMSTSDWSSYVPLGTFRLRGPKHERSVKAICISGQACTIQMHVGLGISSSSLLIANTPCGRTTAMAKISGFTNPQVSSHGGGMLQEFEFGSATLDVAVEFMQDSGSSQIFWLCWAAMKGDVAEVVDHTWLAGSLTLVPDSQNITNSSVEPQNNSAEVVAEEKAMTCRFMLAARIDSVFYEGQDITDTVSGDLSASQSQKQFSVRPVANATMVLNARGAAGSGECSGGGFQILCDHHLFNESSWESFGSSAPLELERKLGKGSGWNAPCKPSVAMQSIERSGGAPIMWAAHGVYAAFRWQLGSCSSPAALSLTNQSSSSVEARSSMGHVLDGLRSCSKVSRAEHGETCFSSCPLGSKKAGHSLACSYGRWNASSAVCPSIRCVAAPSLMSAFVDQGTLVVCRGRAFGEKCSIKCKNGRAAGLLTCGETGDWIGTARCPPPCARMLDPSWMRGEMHCRNIQDGDTCTAPCNPGFVGSDTLLCSSGRWLLGANGSQCVANETGIQRNSQVVVSTTLRNVSYALLVANSSLMDDFKAAVREAIVSRSGARVRHEDVEVVIFAGSVVVQATITPRGDLTAAILRKTLLGASSPAELGEALFTEVNNIDGFSAVSLGEVSVASIRVSIPSPAPAPPNNVTVTSHAHAPAPSEEADGTGAIVGIVVSGVIVFLFIGVCIFCQWRPRCLEDSGIKAKISALAAKLPATKRKSSQNKSSVAQAGAQDIEIFFGPDEAGQADAFPEPERDVKIDEATVLVKTEGLDKNEEPMHCVSSMKTHDGKQMLNQDVGEKAVIGQTMLPEASAIEGEAGAGNVADDRERNVMLALFTTADEASDNEVHGEEQSSPEPAPADYPKVRQSPTAMDDVILQTLLSTIEEEDDEDWADITQGPCGFDDDAIEQWDVDPDDDIPSIIPVAVG